MALAAARAAAWALLFGGWLSLGALAQGQAGPLSLWPLALWLLALSVLRPLAMWWAARPRRLVAALVPLASLTAGLLWAGQAQQPAVLALLVLAWALLVLLVSQAVRCLRPTQALPPARVLAAASAGVLLAWLLTGDPLLLRAQPAGAAALVLLAGGVAAMALLGGHRRTGAAPVGCRRSLFDCALAWPAWRQWQDPRDWPWLAAALVMLPMMAGLPLLSSLCGGLGWPAMAVSAVHAAAMLLPAWVLLGLPDQWRRHAGTALAALLLLGGLAPWCWPGAGGWLAAMLLQSAAWSLAWCAGPLLAMPGVPRPAAAGGWATFFSLTLLGALAAAGQGPSAAPWVALHAALGGLAAAGWLLGRVQAPVSERRPAC